MLRNGSTKIGLFQGMFEQNVLTFNPTDVRTIRDGQPGSIDRLL
jgi:hypothetical protein